MKNKNKNQPNQKAQTKREQQEGITDVSLSIKTQKGTGLVFPFLYPPSSPRDGDGGDGDDAELGRGTKAC